MMVVGLAVAGMEEEGRMTRMRREGKGRQRGGGGGSCCRVYLH